MKHNEVNTELLVMDSHGIYIPKMFVESFGNLCDENGDELTGTLLTDIDICKNPNNVLYWDAWSNVLENVYLYKETHNGMDNELYSLHHHNTLWAIKVDDIDSLNGEESVLFWENYNS
jgi:hypothetical protein